MSQFVYTEWKAAWTSRKDPKILSSRTIAKSDIPKWARIQIRENPNYKDGTLRPKFQFRFISGDPKFYDSMEQFVPDEEVAHD